MIITWDKTDAHVWYGQWTTEDDDFDLSLVAESLPGSPHWAWTVWRAAEPKILRRGIGLSATNAVVAAEAAAAGWLKAGFYALRLSTAIDQHSSTMH